MLNKVQVAVVGTRTPEKISGMTVVALAGHELYLQLDKGCEGTQKTTYVSSYQLTSQGQVPRKEGDEHQGYDSIRYLRRHFLTANSWASSILRIDTPFVPEDEM